MVRSIPRAFSAVCLPSLEGREFPLVDSIGQETKRCLNSVLEVQTSITNKYLAHERLLVLLFSKRNRIPVLIDPLSRWRAVWRAFGFLLLVFNAAAVSSFAWADYRCEGGPLLRDERECINAHRRTLVTFASGMCVQLFSIAEVLLGLATALSIPTTHGLRYGTTSGWSSMPLFLLDLFLLLPQQRLNASSRHVPEARVGFLKHIWMSIRNSVPIKTVTGYQRLKALPPAPWPFQDFIDHVILPAWLGADPTIQILISKLPFVDDALTEGDMLQTAAINFLASAKMFVLAASAVKAARVGARRKRLRELRASRMIVHALRLHLARKKISRLRNKHELADQALLALKNFREWHKNGSSKWWSGLSLPFNLNNLGNLEAMIQPNNQYRRSPNHHQWFESRESSGEMTPYYYS
ncbi:hypothetical protein AB1Y20_018250 [Prymnesium parvum]|uniref:Uncharacterized protein n=1 Tax=Prymnesium parvum TaxID=97485 RepID=A0AB34JMY5_PRYPA